MGDLKTDPITGNLAIENGDFVYITGQDAIDQHLKFRLRFFRGEWFLDTRAGIPYFQRILKKNPDPVVLNSIFKQAILKTPGVLQLTSFELTVDASARRMTLTFSAITEEGPLDFSEVIIP